MTIEFRRINHITVNAPSGSQTQVLWFYGTILGLKLIPIPEKLIGVYEILWFQLLEILLHIEFVKDFVAPSVVYENGVILPGRHIALEIKNIQHVRELLHNEGITLYEGVTLTDRDRFYAVDPFGNFLELIEFHSDQKRERER